MNLLTRESNPTMQELHLVVTLLSSSPQHLKMAPLEYQKQQLTTKQSLLKTTVSSINKTIKVTQE